MVVHFVSLSLNYENTLTASFENDVFSSNLLSPRSIPFFMASFVSTLEYYRVLDNAEQLFASGMGNGVLQKMQPIPIQTQ